MTVATMPSPVKTVNHIHQKNVEINFTSSLSMFKWIDGNRPPNPQHVSNIVKSIQKYGVLCNPILVNERYEVIDGQHRLLATKETNTPIYYIKVKGYGLKEVHALNMYQKNWTGKDFLDAYANMGMSDYEQLREFQNTYPEFSLTTCINLCSNTSNRSFHMQQKDTANIRFNDGTWKSRDMKIARRYAEQLKQLASYYKSYNNARFVSAMLSMFSNKNFDFAEFIQKLRIQPTALVDCANITQYKELIEEIYNYKRREKVNLRF